MRPRWRLALGVVLLGLALAGGAVAVNARDAPDGIRALRATTSTGRRGAYFIPPTTGSQALPLLVFLHGTGGKGSTAILKMRAIAERERFVAVAPDSVSVAGTWLVSPSPQGVTEDHRHVMGCVREVLTLPDAHIDRRQVLIAGFSVGGGAASQIASDEDIFTAFAVLHGHVPVDGLGPRRVRGWLSAGDRDRLRTAAAIRSLGDELKQRARFPEVETRVFAADHSLGEEELAALIVWWLRRERGPA